MKHEHLFVTWNSREKLARDVVKTLPALVNFMLGDLPSGWFNEKLADRIIDQVVYHMDEETNAWTGTWHTQADQDNEEMVQEMMPGMQSVQMENLLAMLAEAEEARQDSPDARNFDGMSTDTSVARSTVFEAVLGVSRPSTVNIPPPPPNPIEDPPHTPPQVADVAQTSAQQSPGSEPVAVQGTADPLLGAGVTAG